MQIVPQRIRRSNVPELFRRIDELYPEAFRISNDVFPMDIEKTDEAYVVHAELPGVKKEEIDISVENKILAIDVTRETVEEKSNAQMIHKERSRRSMCRRIRLEEVDEENVKARLENGVLHITLPFKQQKEAAKIEIQSADVSEKKQEKKE